MEICIREYASGLKADRKWDKVGAYWLDPMT